MESNSPPSARVDLDKSDPNGDIAKAGYLRKEKSGNDRYIVLWSEPLQGTKYSRLEFYNDEKTFHKQKPPRRVIPIVDLAAVYGGESVPGQHSFSVLLKSQEKINLVASSVEEKDSWFNLLNEFVQRRPNGRRLGFDWQFQNVEVCPQELGQVIGLAVIKPIPCCVAFNTTDFAVLYQLRHKPRFICPIRCLRSCGFNGNTMYIHCGRRAPCGEGRLYFQAESEAIARQIKDALFGEMCRGANTTTRSGTIGSSPPVHTLPTRAQSAQTYTHDSHVPRMPQSYTDGFEHHGPRPRAVAMSNGTGRSFHRQLSDPQFNMRVNQLSRSQTFNHGTTSSESSTSDEFAPGSAQNPGYISRPRIVSGYEDMGGRVFRDDAYEDMSPRASFDASRYGDYENTVPGRSFSSSSYDRHSGSDRSSVPNALQGLDAHISSLSLRSDEHSYENIDPKKFAPGTKFIMVPGSGHDSDNAEYENLPLFGSPGSRISQSSAPIPFTSGRMPPPRSHSDDHSGLSWHNQPYSAEKMSHPEEGIFQMDSSPPQTASPSHRGSHGLRISDVGPTAVTAQS